jgi:hypothetical protein
VAFAFDTGRLVDDIQNSIAFADRFGGAFGDASAAGDAVFKNFHGHGRDSCKRICCDYKIIARHHLRQLTIIITLVNFVTVYLKPIESYVEVATGGQNSSILEANNQPESSIF